MEVLALIHYVSFALCPFHQTDGAVIRIRRRMRLLGYKTQFVPQRRHITSPLQSPAS
jgi:hypothetical protein